MIRNCKPCRGTRMVQKVPAAMKLYPALGGTPEVSYCLCTGCEGSGYQILDDGVWRPLERSKIRIEDDGLRGGSPRAIAQEQTGEFPCST